MDWLYETFAGKLLRLPLKCLPPRWKIPILSGPNRDLRWTIGAGYDAHWLGIYEQNKARRLAAAIHPGNTVWDVGANVGYYTLLASRRVGPTGHVVAFEPLPANLAFLRTHIHNNALSNVQVVPKALGSSTTHARFEVHPVRSMGKLSAGGNLEVEVIAGDNEIAHGRLPVPDVIKMDIEGGEVEALPGLQAALEKARVVFVATHGSAARAQVERLGGFEEFERDEFMRCARG